MNWAEITIKTTHEATEAVADIFNDFGANGVVIEDPKLINRYKETGGWEYWGIAAEKNVDVVTIKAYLALDAGFSEKLRRFEQRVDNLSDFNLDKGMGLITWREVKEEDWANSWKEYFHPVKVGEKIVIKPTWREYSAAENDLVIELDPAMAFGTGTHHTTAMCIRMLESAVKPGDNVFDIGAGSGILALAAYALGAAHIEAVDIDPVAVRTAKENVRLNKADGFIKVKEGDLLSALEEAADIIVANIIAAVLVDMAAKVALKLKDGGFFIGGGIIADALNSVTEALIKNGLTIKKVTEEGGWVTVLAQKGAA